MEQQRIESLDDAITDLRLKLIQTVGSYAEALGFTTDEIQDLMTVVQPEFFKLWFAGIPDSEALTQAVQKGDLIVSRTSVEKSVAAGESPEAAFDRIRQMKLAAGAGEPETEAMAEKATEAFQAALANGESAGDAVETAFATATAA